MLFFSCYLPLQLQAAGEKEFGDKASGMAARWVFLWCQSTGYGSTPVLVMYGTRTGFRRVTRCDQMALQPRTDELVDKSSHRACGWQGAPRTQWLRPVSLTRLFDSHSGAAACFRETQIRWPLSTTDGSHGFNIGRTWAAQGPCCGEYRGSLAKKAPKRCTRLAGQQPS